jgi:hypothetical protein
MEKIRLDFLKKITICLFIIFSNSRIIVQFF